MKKIASSPRKSKQNQKRQSKKCQPKTSIYRVGNWSEYNEALKQRGNLTVWFSEAVIGKWYYDGPTKQGAQFTYSDSIRLARKSLAKASGRSVSTAGVSGAPGENFT